MKTAPTQREIILFRRQYKGLCRVQEEIYKACLTQEELEAIPHIHIMDRLDMVNEFQTKHGLSDEQMDVIMDKL